jgi:energy-coupling factor transport system ATP-binding protein
MYYYRIFGESDNNFYKKSDGRDNLTAIVQFKNFSFRYPHKDFDIIHEANFTIDQGTCTLLYGLSGSGKSTLCYAMTGLIPWSIRGFFKGEIYIFGKNTLDVKPNQFAGNIGYLMQNPDSQFATLSVQDELVFAAENIRLEKQVIESRLGTIINLLDLNDYLDRNVTQLSSGEKQRVVLGSILMMKPKLLILDEPLSFLDFPNRIKLLEFLQKIMIEFPTLSVIIAEHRIHDIIPIANNFLEIKNSQIKQTGLLSSTDRKFAPKSSTSFSYKDLVQYYGFKELNNIHKDDSEEILSFNNVSFEYVQDIGKFKQRIVPVISDLSFKIYPKESIAIIGPNGIGKTTLLYLLAGILQPSKGEIRFHNQDISKIQYGQYSRNIGLIFQNPESQLLKNTVKKEIEFGPKNFHVQLSEEDLHNYVTFIFPTTQQSPDELLKCHPFNLSWGEKRRLNLVSLFAYLPSIYLFDEPFTGQDFLVRKDLMDTIETISDNFGATIFSSHDEEILDKCDRVFLLDESGFSILSKTQEVIS